jgi:hypothetical protein
MNKAVLLLLILIQGCGLSLGPKPRPNLPPPSPTSIHQMGASDFNKIDQNSDGVLDRGEIRNAAETDPLEMPLKVFFALVVAIGGICLLPLIPDLIKGAVKLYKDRKTRDADLQE